MDRRSWHNVIIDSDQHDVPQQCRSRAVGALAGLERDDRVLLARTARNPGYWQPIGGSVEDGPDGREPPLRCVLREIVEETGWHIDPNDLDHIFDLEIDGEQGTISFFHGPAPDETLRIDHQEFVELGWFDRSEVRRLPAQPLTARFLVWWSTSQPR